MKNTRTILLFVLLPCGLLLAGVLLSACQPGPPSWPIGLSELSPDGRWAVIAEHQAEPRGWRVILTDLQDGHSEVVAEGLAADPEVRFSPESGYMLYRIEGVWNRIDLPSLQQVVLSDRIGTLEFLPGERLLALARENNWTTFQIIDLSRPETPTLSIDQVRYIFTDRLPDLSGDGLAARALSCPVAENPDQAAWALIRENGDLSVLSVTPDRIDQRSLAPRLAAGATQVLAQQASDLENKIAKAREDLRELIQASGEAQGDIPEDEDPLQYLLESNPDPNTILETIPDPNTIIDLTLLGTLSPDGSKLLFLRYEPGDLDLFGLMGQSQEDPLFFGLLGAMIRADQEQQGSRFHLYLINLETGGEPAVLSSETSWAPAFTFSRDGQQILFESNLYGHPRALYLADADNQDRRRLSETGVEALCWR